MIPGSTPDIEWLQRRWHLPDPAVPYVMNLLDEEARGSTALAVGEDIQFGDAISTDGPLDFVSTNGQAFLQSKKNSLMESRIARRIRTMASEPASDLPGLSAVAELFPNASNDDRQALAVSTALRRRLTMITGGPGTGKTFTLARILLALAQSNIPDDQIRLAAPTGKAAERMKNAIRDSVATLGSGFASQRDRLNAIADSSSTIHALLGYNPDQGSCRFQARSPLPCQVLILDESSMIDLSLWAAVLDALAPSARLVVLGDPNQLESVGAGAVFSEFIELASNNVSPLAPCHVHLTEARRFRDRPAILKFAKAIEAANGDAAIEILSSSKPPADSAGLCWIEPAATAGPSVHSFPPVILGALNDLARAETPAIALNSLEKICILTAQKNFFVGSLATSIAIDKHFSRDPLARNQPIIINVNDPETGLRNGSTGIIHTDPDGKRLAWFASGHSGLKSFPPAKLPDFSPAWAITIHRSQGSEFDNVLVILPLMESPLASRELLYTAITRARKNVFVSGDLEVVRRAASSRASRQSLLSYHFHADSGAEPGIASAIAPTRHRPPTTCLP